MTFFFFKVGLTLSLVYLGPIRPHGPDCRHVCAHLQTFQLMHATNHPSGPSYLLQISPDTDSKHGWVCGGGWYYWAFIHPTEWFENIHSISVKITIRTASLPLQISRRQAARGFLCRDVSQIGLVIRWFYYSHIIWVLYHIKGFLMVVLIEACYAPGLTIFFSSLNHPKNKK